MLVISLSIILMLFFFLLFTHKDEGFRILHSSTNEKLLAKFEKLESKFYKDNPELNFILGKNMFFKILCPSLLILISSFYIAAKLTLLQHSIFLAFIISFAYISRWIYHFSIQNKEKLFEDLQRIFALIRSNLSLGLPLDSAINIAASNYSNNSLIIVDLKAFLNLHQRNILEFFPLWFKSLESKFQLKILANCSQLLMLELKYNNNQEDVFIRASNTLANSISCIKQQQNIINTTFLTLDFFVLLFFLVLFYIIPNLCSTVNLDWWASSSRSLVVFISASLLWLIYGGSIVFCWFRLR